ncbi:MAG: hypothetical protein Q9208_002396 [Pyrenodesmia sp. 3 TL-2023]
MFSSFPLRFYYLLPLVGGTAWFFTLAALWGYWLGQGRPVYPSQLNPYVAFISDIGAYRLKPLFIAGGTVTAIAYAGTIFAAHHVRYDPDGYGIKDARWKKVLSIVALVAGVTASVGCISMTIFDTKHYTTLHRPMLLATFLGIALSACCTEVVYVEQMKPSTEFKEMRK